MDSREVRHTFYPVLSVCVSKLARYIVENISHGNVCVTVIIDARKLCEGLLVIT